MTTTDLLPPNNPLSTKQQSKRSKAKLSSRFGKFKVNNQDVSIHESSANIPLSNSVAVRGSVAIVRHESPASSASLTTSENIDGYGLLQLYPYNSRTIPPSQDQNIDIVAIHGIDGRRGRTWRHPETQKIWLQDPDFLPRDFPGARIFSFGYQAEVYSYSTGSIETFATGLLDSLENEAKSCNGAGGKRRKIIFIAHSMGGLVVKKALHIAAKLYPLKYPDLVESVIGIAFMATPHNGSGLAGSATKVAALFPMLPIRADLIRPLEKNSNESWQINYDFVQYVSKLTGIASFVEEKKYSLLRLQIVDKQSSVMVIANGKLVKMDGENHRTICQFAKRSGSYQKLLAELRVFVDMELERVCSSLEDEFRKALYFPEMSSAQNAVKPAAEKTCEWIETHKKYLEWATIYPSMLWLKGNPGAGKSTLMASLVCKRHRIQNDSTIILSHYFQDRGAPLQRSKIGMLRSLLHQVMADLPPPVLDFCKSVFDEKLKVAGTITPEWSVTELESTFKRVVLAVTQYREVVIYIDAIDEAGDDTQNVSWYMQGIFREALQQNAKIKFCVSSRLFPVVQYEFGTEIVVDQHNSEDIGTFVGQELLKARSLTDEHIEELRPLVRERSGGIFLWADRAVKQIIQYSNEGESYAFVRKVVHETPEMMEDVWKRTLLELGEGWRWKRSYKLLSWLNAAAIPLSVSDLRTALQLDNEKREEFTDSDSQMKRLVSTLSGGLVVVARQGTRDVVQFAHQSIKDLLDKSELSQLMFPGNTNIFHELGDTHLQILKACLAQFRSPAFGSKLRTLTSVNELQHVRDQFPFSEYAARCWTLHHHEALKSCSQAVMPDLVQEWRSSLGMRWTTKPYQAMSNDALEIDMALLHTAIDADLGVVAESLLNEQPELAIMRGRLGYQALHLACKSRCDRVLGAVFNASPDLESESEWQATPLTIAIMSENHQAVRMLLQRGVSASKFIISDRGHFVPPLFFAIECGWYFPEDRIKVVEALLDAGADMGPAYLAQGTLLQAAARRGFVDIMRLLVSRGADIHRTLKAEDTDSGTAFTALQVAVSSLQQASITVLLELGAHLDQAGEMIGDCLQAAVAGRWDWSTEVPMTEEEICRLRMEVVERILACGVDVNAEGGRFGSALQTAVIAKHSDVVALLLRHGADVNHRGGKHGSALQAAAFQGNVEIARMLIEAGADVNSSGGTHGSPLAAAAGMEIPEFTYGRDPSSYRDVFRLLMENGAEVPRAIPWIPTKTDSGDRFLDLRIAIRETLPQPPRRVYWYGPWTDTSKDMEDLVSYSNQFEIL